MEMVLGGFTVTAAPSPAPRASAPMLTASAINGAGARTIPEDIEHQLVTWPLPTLPW
jgi:hypothetical protein